MSEIPDVHLSVAAACTVSGLEPKLVNTDYKFDSIGVLNGNHVNLPLVPLEVHLQQVPTQPKSRRNACRIPFVRQ